MDFQQTAVLIPARRGSKGIPGKNVVDLGGRPLVAWTLEAARSAGAVTETYVTTDDPLVAEIAQTFGAHVIERPSSLATDDAGTAEVVAHALSVITTGRLLLLQPTSPFRNADHVQSACAAHDLANHGVVSVVLSEHPNEWEFPMNPETGTLLMENRVLMPRRRQDAPARYRLNGAIYVGTPDQWGPDGDIFSSELVAFEMDRLSSLDIDDPLDLEFARFLVNRRVTSD